MTTFDESRLDRVTPADPLRVLFSACLLGDATGWEGGPYTAPLLVRFAGLANVAPIRFCPENHGLGTPRPFTTIHDGHGRDVLAGRARVLETTGRDVTKELVAGARAMLEVAQKGRAELAVLMEISDSCGSHALYFGDSVIRRYQKGTGVAAAVLGEAGIPIVGSRDAATLGRILGKLDPTFVAEEGAIDFVETEWYREYFTDGSPGVPLAEYEARKKTGR